MFSFLFPRRRPALLPHLHFILYTRHGCHLCEEAHGRLQDAQRRHGFHLELVDVDHDPDLAARYGELVPVIAVNGTVRFRGGLNPVLLDRLLRGEAARAKQ